MVQVESNDGAAESAVTRTSSSRRRWWRRILVAGVAVLLVLVAATIGIGYYFSSVLLVVDNSTSFPLTVRAVDGDQVTLDRDEDTERPVILSLVWADGSAILDDAVKIDGEHVVRTVSSSVRGKLEAGLQVAVDDRIYQGDPRTARGLEFESVTIHGELGDLPAWFVPPTTKPASKTWVIVVHGRGPAATRTESLRVLPALAATGLPTLVTSYRNDIGAPESPDGYYHLGDTEWRDVGSAVEYARANGASGVVLYGWSMGGALVMTALRRMPADEAALVRGVMLDSGNIDWNAILDLQGGSRGLPSFVTWTAKRFIEWRADLSLGDFDQRAYASRLGVPMLIFVDDSDHTVPPGPAKEFARSRPDLVTLVTTSGGGHTACWNADPAAYEAAMSRFLARFDGA